MPTYAQPHAGEAPGPLNQRAAGPARPLTGRSRGGLLASLARCHSRVSFPAPDGPSSATHPHHPGSMTRSTPRARPTSLPGFRTLHQVLSAPLRTRRGCLRSELALARAVMARRHPEQFSWPGRPRSRTVATATAPPAAPRDHHGTRPSWPTDEPQRRRRGGTRRPSGCAAPGRPTRCRRHPLPPRRSPGPPTCSMNTDARKRGGERARDQCRVLIAPRPAGTHRPITARPRHHRRGPPRRQTSTLATLGLLPHEHPSARHRPPLALTPGDLHSSHAAAGQRRVTAASDPGATHNLLVTGLFVGGRKALRCANVRQRRCDRGRTGHRGARPPASIHQELPAGNVPPSVRSGGGWWAGCDTIQAVVAGCPQPVEVVG